jgi:hypothetical protein
MPECNCPYSISGRGWENDDCPIHGKETSINPLSCAYGCGYDMDSEGDFFHVIPGCPIHDAKES